MKHEQVQKSTISVLSDEKIRQEHWRKKDVNTILFRDLDDVETFHCLG